MLQSSEVREIRLRDGRRLGFAEYGSARHADRALPRIADHAREILSALSAKR